MEEEYFTEGFRISEDTKKLEEKIAKLGIRVIDGVYHVKNYTVYVGGNHWLEGTLFIEDMTNIDVTYIRITGAKEYTLSPGDLLSMLDLNDEKQKGLIGIFRKEHEKHPKKET